MSENYIGDVDDRQGSYINHERLRELADKLARIDSAAGDNLQSYSNFLHQLSAAYDRMPSHIANTTTASHELLQRYKIDITVLQLLEDMVRVHQPNISREYAYSQVLCMYVFMRNEGKTREVACEHLMRQIARNGRKIH